MENLRDLFVIVMSIVMVMRKDWLIVTIIHWNLMLVVDITLKLLEWIVMVRTCSKLSILYYCTGCNKLLSFNFSAITLVLKEVVRSILETLVLKVLMFKILQSLRKTWMIHLKLFVDQFVLVDDVATTMV